jgi:N-acetylglucosamine-6-phosphate deacetylase
MFLITDAVTACSNGPYQHVFSHDHYIMPDGTLSGSALTMLKAIKNCVNHVNIPLDEAIRMATTYPANLINNVNHELKIGLAANMVLLDKNLKIQYTIMASQIHKISFFSGLLRIYFQI